MIEIDFDVLDRGLLIHQVVQDVHARHIVGQVVPPRAGDNLSHRHTSCELENPKRIK